MEVHHHPNLTHKEKPWKEYLLEGLMIFLAVSLGFIAENIREHLSEKNKKKELIEMVSLDFERDIKQLDYHKQLALEKIQRCDSLINFLNSDNTKISEDLYYKLITQVQWWWFFNSNNKSRTEADSKGYLSSVQNSDLAYNILKYDFFHTDYKSVEDAEMKTMVLFKTEASKITEHYIYDRYCLTNKYPKPSSVIGIKKNDPTEIMNAKYLLTELKHSNSGYIMDIDSMKAYAQKAIDNIKIK